MKTKKLMLMWFTGLWLSIALIFGVSLEGCGPKVTVTGAPTGVDPAGVANWYKATGAYSQIADLVRQAQLALLQAHKMNLPDGSSMLPDGEYYQKLLTAFGKIAVIQESSAQFLKTVPQSFTAKTQARISADTSAILEAIQSLNSTGVLGIKDTATQQQIKNLLSEIESAVQFVLTFAQPTTSSNATVPWNNVVKYAEMKEVYVG